MELILGGIGGLELALGGMVVLLVLVFIAVSRRRQVEDVDRADEEMEESSWAILEERPEFGAADEATADEASSVPVPESESESASGESPSRVEDEESPVDEPTSTVVVDAEEVDAGQEIAEETPEDPVEEVDPGSILGRFLRGLKRSREAIAESLASLLSGKELDEAALESLEDTLVSADIGVRAAMEITQKVRSLVQEGNAAEIKGLLRSELIQRLGESSPLQTDGEGPQAILVVGVNGSGKTTTIGKLAARYLAEGKSVLLAAGDTFRAGAIEQLKVWGERAGVPVIAHQEGGDPAAVIFDALQAARARNIDLVICDTAGRLQAQQALMDELAKIVRVMGKALPGAPHEVLLVLDSTIGQNAVSQARSFKEVVGVTGIALTKLDGTARGGVVVAICDELEVPVKLVGLGENMDDLRDFEPEAFVDALLG